MSYWINKAGNNTRSNWRYFYCDSDEDITNLPTSISKGIKQDVDTSANNECSIGSKCKALSTNTIYILNSNNIWTAQVSAGGGTSSQNGKSAYQIAVEYGFDGTIEEWLESLHGEDGEDGTPGADGFSPTIIENSENNDTVYKLDITSKDNTFTTPNLMGPDGEDGVTPKLTIGDVTTLNEGEEATASITGTSENPILNLGIPKGQDGFFTQTDHNTNDTTFTLEPNQLHTWGEVSSLTLTLGSGASGIVNEYMFSFTSGATATTLSLPESIQTDIVVEPNTHYECSIVNNYMVFRDWPIEEESA